MAAEDFRQRLQAETERRVAAIREQQEGSYEKLAQLHEEHGQAIRDRQLDEWVAGVMGPLRAQLDEQPETSSRRRSPGSWRRFSGTAISSRCSFCRR